MGERLGDEEKEFLTAAFNMFDKVTTPSLEYVTDNNTLQILEIIHTQSSNCYCSVGAENGCVNPMISGMLRRLGCLA